MKRKTTSKRLPRVPAEPTVKAKEVTYERLVNIGNYENLRLGITVEVGKGGASEALAKAKKFIDGHCARMSINPDEYEAAKQLVNQVESIDDEIPF